MTEADYITYLEELASKHAAIQHSAESPRCFVVTDDNYTELKEQLREVTYPVVLIDQYYDDLLRQNDNNRFRVLGGLSVLVGCEVRNPKDKRRARQEARAIALQFINRMIGDSLKPGNLLSTRKVVVSRDFEGEPTPVITDEAAGWGYPFEWTLPTTVNPQPGSWLDQ